MVKATEFVIISSGIWVKVGQRDGRINNGIPKALVRIKRTCGVICTGTADIGV